jgi:hypothetical protein
MSDAPKNLELVRGEAKSLIHWGKEPQEVADLLRDKHGILGEEADAMIVNALAERKKQIRLKALLRLAFAAVGLVVAITYFAIQSSVGFLKIGFGPILMGSLGLTSLLVAGRSIVVLLVGDASGPV